MIPITRKELYLNKIVGNNDYDIPEKPISEEEFFFAEILGEAVQAPEPFTRYQMYLAKIAKREIEIPYPETRLEYFLAKAAGMEIETPTPITREEIFWSNYSAIVDFEVEGVPPLTYKAIEGTLENYRIYGNTVGGESVGDKTGNLFDENTLISPIGSLSWYFDNHYLMSNSSSGDGRSWTYDKSQFKFLLSSGTYCLSFDIPIIETTRIFSFFMCDDNNTEILFFDLKNRTSYSTSFTINNNTNIGIVFKIPRNIKVRIMLNSGSTPLPYEPYGYKVPVTVSNGTDTQAIPIYLPEPIKMVGDEAEYIDYAEQKQHRVRKNLLPNTATSQTINGVTFTVNNDGSITCNGTATASAPSVLYIPFTLPIKLYELSGCPDSGSNSTYRVDIRNIDYSMYKYNGDAVVDNGTGCLFDGGNKQYCIRIAPGYTCNNLTFYPMIRKADIEDDTYEPYIADTELDVTLPALPTLSGTNTLSVGTEITPSKVYIKGEKEREYT